MRGDAQEHGEFGGENLGLRRDRTSPESEEHGGGRSSSDERLGVVWRCDLIGAKGRKEEVGEGFKAMVTGRGMEASIERNRGRDRREVSCSDEQMTSTVMSSFYFYFSF